MSNTENNSGTRFDYPATVRYLRDMMDLLEADEDSSIDMVDSIREMHSRVRKLDVPADTLEDISTAFETLGDKLIELHNAANESARWIDEVLDQLKALPMSE